MMISRAETRLLKGKLVLAVALVLAIQCRTTSGSNVFNVGYQVLDLNYEKNGEEQVITLAVWYPTAVQPKSYSYGGPTRGEVAVDALPLTKGGPYPLLVYSHGYSGSGLAAVFFTERLAAQGWVVVAPDHHDKYSAVRIRSGQKEEFDRRGLIREARQIASSSPADRWKYLYRVDEMKRTVDWMLEHTVFGKVIDSHRIAVAGHSFGGFTALGLCGTIEERYEPRIKAVLLFSTGAGGYLFTAAELQRVRIPSMLFIGERERDQKRGTTTMKELAEKIYSNVSMPKHFLEIEGGSHGSFNNRFSDTLGARLLSGTEKTFEVIRKYSIAFLQKHVVGSKDAGGVLDQKDEMLSEYRRE